MNWREKYWPGQHGHDRLAVASERALAAFCVMAGGGGIAITIINLQFLPEFIIQVGLGGVVALFCLFAPLLINGSDQFQLRARILGSVTLVALAYLSFSNGSLYSPSNLLLIPAIMTFTLALGAKDGAFALGLAALAYLSSYLDSRSAGVTGGIDSEFGALLISSGFVWVGTAVFRLEMSRSLIMVQDEKLKADQANAAKSEFLANMSHEIRTPLNGVLGMATVLEATNLEASQKRAVEVIKSSGSHLLAMLNDILDLSKIEADELELEDIEFVPLEVLNGVRDLHAPTAETGGLELKLTIAEGLDLKTERIGDPTRLAQVLHNLVSNAVKFTAEGQVEIVVQPLGDVEGLVVEVRDTGCGMTALQVEKIFQPFIQADSSTTRQFGGTGLGLAICRRIVLAMGGQLSVESKPDVGSTFRLELALPRVAERLAPTTMEPPTDTAGISGLRVLVVDDSETNRLVAAGLLRPVEARVTLAESGERALHLFRQGQFDLVFMDIRMPGMDGFEALKQIRTLEASSGQPQTPVVAMTANVMGTQLEQYMAAGFADFVAKPIDQANLIEVTRRTASS